MQIEETCQQNEKTTLRHKSARSINKFGFNCTRIFDEVASHNVMQPVCYNSLADNRRVLLS